VRELLREYGVPVPRGAVASTVSETEGAARELGTPVVIKAQVLTGGRGKAGGVVRASTPLEARAAAQEILAKRVGGYPVARVLVVAAVDIAKEYYVAITVDRSAQRVSCMVSAAGGIDIEEIAKKSPEKIVTLGFEPESNGVLPRAELEPIFGDRAEEAAGIIERLYALFCAKDLSLLEINPLVVAKDGTMLALDAKAVADDNALYKHPDIEKLRNPEEYTDEESAARRAGLSFISLTGSIGCMVNGAGLAMATMDLITLLGGRPANFLDVGGSSNPEKVVAAFRILLANPAVKVVLVNIFGGITRCDDIARGIVAARESLHITPPLVVRLTGTNEAAGRKLLLEAGIAGMTGMTEAVQRAIDEERKPHEHTH
jgi:succinyl-CoA synthetase beta subunit